VARPRRDRLTALIVPVAAVVLVASACSLSGGPGFGEGVVAGATTSTTSTHSTPGGPATPSPTPPAPPAWAPCSAGAGPTGFDCATISVPLDYRNPNAGSIALALDRQPATGTKIGSLLVNPGGPGASGVDALSFEDRLLSPTVRAHFDVVGFDPRGVARSSPVTCVDGPALDRYLHLDPAPTTDAGWQALVAAAKTIDQACEAKSGPVLPFVGTENAARDMDQIRQALGDTRLNYLGFSYGTLLGATYADLFPTKVRTMALDGALDPAADPIAINIAQSAAFDKELNAFFADCAARASCAWRPGGDLHTAFDALMARIRARPLPGSAGRTVGPGEALYGVILPLYDRTSWPDLAVALNLADHGVGSLLLRYFDLYNNRNPDGSYGNQQAANSAVNCLDAPWPADPEVLRRDAALAASSAPEFGVADLYGGLTCVFWPVPATGRPHAIRAPGAPPIVVVGSTGDPATPYAQAQALAAELEHGVLITRVGDGHTGYRSSACVRRAVDAYLVDLTAPANPTTCPSP
jgi:pimeloyl-ACP methyl ester carboxylesterase